MKNYPHLVVSSAPRSGSTPLAQFLSGQDNLMILNEIGLYLGWDNKNKWKNTKRRSHWMNYTANEMIFESKGLTLEDFRQATINGKFSGRDQFRWLLENTDVDFIGDKCPIVYIREMNKLAQKFPKAKFLIVVRDGRDVVASQIRSYYKWPPGNPQHAPHWMKPTIKEAQNLWVRVNKSTINKLKKMDPSRYMKFRYEDAAIDPDSFCNDLSEFLRIDIVNKSDYFKPTNVGKWQEVHPNMMDELSKEFKDMLRRLRYEKI